MGYTAGFLNEMVVPLNRKEAKADKFGLDSGGIEWEEVGCLHANVDYQRGKSAMNAGSLDVYAVKIVRMRWTDCFNERSRIKWRDNIYQIIPETFNANRRENSLQFLMQLIVNDK
jgi:head-tail adaptor